MTAAPTGHGYWEVAGDGGIFAFGSAGFEGSMGGTPLNAPVVGMATDSATGGYWLVGADGGVFAFTAPFHGSLAGRAPLTNPVAPIASTPNGSGYWLLPMLPPAVPGVPALGEPAPIGGYGSSTVGLGHVEPCQVSFGGAPPACTPTSHGPPGEGPRQ